MQIVPRVGCRRNERQTPTGADGEGGAVGEAVLGWDEMYSGES